MSVLNIILYKFPTAFVRITGRRNSSGLARQLKILQNNVIQTPCASQNIYIFYFIYFWLRWVFVAAHGLSLVVASGVHSSLQCVGFSFVVASLVAECGLQAHGLQQLWHVGFSSCGLRALGHRLSSCGAQAQLLRGMWDLPGPGLEPVSPALAGGFLTTVSPGKSLPPRILREGIKPVQELCWCTQ